MPVISDVFKVYTDSFEYKSTDGNYYVQGVLEVAGYVDSVNDVVTKECILDMAKQIKNQEVKAMFKGNLEHEHISNDMRLVPRAKITDAEVKGEKLIVTTMLNKHHPDFNNLWGSISDGFLDAFSMEFKPIEWANQQFGGKPVRVLNKVQLGGVAFTGRPINDACKITEFFCKSKAMMEEEMDDEDKKEMETMMKNGMSKEDAMKKMKEKKKKMIKKSFTEEDKMEKAEVKSEAPVDYSKEVLELKSQVEKLTSSLEVKSKEIEALRKVEVKSLTETEVKSIVEEALKNSQSSKPIHEASQEKFEKKSFATIGDAFLASRGIRE